MSIEDLLNLCEAYNDLGSAVQEQLSTLADYGEDADPDELNPNAVRMILDGFLTDAARLEVDGAATLAEVARAWLDK